jgi:23S rRNA (uracil1939-C5)-methyltransferase
MALTSGQRVELTIDKPAAGGRMIARHEGQVVLVLGAIPGERVLAQVERAERSLAFADAIDVLEPSPDRRDGGDLRCGGNLYAHVTYPRQLALKAEVIADAFARLGRIPLAEPLAVAASPQRGYRMRGRVHVHDGTIGYYREGSHDVCDARQTGQLADDAITAMEVAAAALAAEGADVAWIMVSENIAGDERAIAVELSNVPSALRDAAERAVAAAGLTGCSLRAADGSMANGGVPAVRDPLTALTAGRAPSGLLQRRPEAFFQANRFLLPSLVTAVLDAVPLEGEVLDLYAGVGLFSVALAGTGRTQIVAVEGDRTSAADLMLNAGPCSAAVKVATSSVEDYLARRRGPAPRAIVVDPPRTGISKEAMKTVARQEARRVVYVSCDPATMARDARRLLDAGYRLESLRAFDLFPNTPHVETLGVFDR